MKKIMIDNRNAKIAAFALVAVLFLIGIDQIEKLINRKINVKRGEISDR